MIVMEGNDQVSQLVYIREDYPYEVTLLLSPWPCDVPFRKLRLTRMSAAESSRYLVHWAAKRLQGPGLGARLTRLARRMAAGQAIGVSSGGSNSVDPLDNVPAQMVSDRGALTSSVVDGIEIFMEEGDSLHDQAVSIVQAEFSQSPCVHAVYTDVCEGGRLVTRTAWDPMLTEYADIPAFPVFFRAGASGMAPLQRLKELALRSGPGAIAHVALPLAHRPVRSVPVFAPIPCPELMPWPSVSIVIPTGPRTDMLRKCLDGLRTTDYPALQVVVVANGADQRVLTHALNEASGALQIISLEDRAPFNFSRSCNRGVEQTTGEIIVLLNDDVEIIDISWLKRMVASVACTNAGAVGARLLYPDRSIQHAGVMLGIGGVCGHLWKGMSSTEAERIAAIVYPGLRMAVTGACLAVRRDLYRQVGGLNERDFPIGMNDVDFCLRLGAVGLQTIYRGDAVLVHHEGRSRGFDDDTITKRRRRTHETAAFLERWAHLIHNDPIVSPAFDPRSERGITHRSLSCGGDVRN